MARKGEKVLGEVIRKKYHVAVAMMCVHFLSLYYKAQFADSVESGMIYTTALLVLLFTGIGSDKTSSESGEGSAAVFPVLTMVNHFIIAPLVVQAAVRSHPWCFRRLLTFLIL